MKRFVIFLFSALLIGNLYPQDNIREITILHWNDFHSHDLPEKRQKKDSTGKEYIYWYGGTADMLGYVNKFRNQNTLVLNAGDDFQGTPISTITRGKSQIELLNLYNLDAFVIGNHEFDYGQFALDSALQLAKFDYLSANVFFKPKEKTFGKSYVIRDIDGIKTGIIGITLPELPEVTLPKNVSKVEMLNTDSAIQANIDVLKKDKCNLIVLLTHAGVHNDSIFASKFYKDVDVIVGGHSHTPLFKPLIVNGVVIVQAGSYGRWLGKLDLQVDTDKDTVVSHHGKLIETVLDSAIYDKAAAEKVEKMEDAVSVELKKVIGIIKTDWRAGYNEESNLGQFEADAFKEAVRTDIAFINGGGLRKSLYIGDVTVGDIWEINPFGNTIVTFPVSGKTLKEMLVNNIKIRYEKKKTGESSEILEVSGLTYSYDLRKIESGGAILADVKVNGSEVEDNKIYSIATNNFVTEQFLKFFGEVSENIKFKDTGMIDRDAVIEAVEKQKVINSVLENRIVDLSK
jgi:2',3'-cyclic-nucleotide 2'-phosphodiesterase (5'-nucleotidase family)